MLVPLPGHAMHAVQIDNDQVQDCSFSCFEDSFFLTTFHFVSAELYKLARSSWKITYRFPRITDFQLWGFLAKDMPNQTRVHVKELRCNALTGRAERSCTRPLLRTLTQMVYPLTPLTWYIFCTKCSWNTVARLIVHKALDVEWFSRQRCWENDVVAT